MSQRQRVVGYFPNWALYRKPPLQPCNLNANLLTHLNYAFVKVGVDGSVTLTDTWADIEYGDVCNGDKPFRGHFEQLLELKRQYPHLKTLLSVGGWSLSAPFSQMAESRAARRRFVENCLSMCQRYGFDGIDIDWEFPGYAEHSGRPQDTMNFRNLLRELSATLRKQSSPLLLTIAAPASPTYYEHIEVHNIHSYLDWINLMTYDFSGPWCSTVQHHAPLYSTSISPLSVNNTVEYYLSQGVPADKLVIGIPFYGRSFAGASNGLGGSFSAAGCCSEGQDGGTLFYSDIHKNYLRNSSFEYKWDDEACVPCLANRTSHEWISFEDEKSIQMKAQYVKKRGLGGVMVWELGQDLMPDFLCLQTIVESLSVS